MNLNRSRVAAAGAISAALMVGMPMVTAASAGAVQDPAQIFDDPPPAGGTPPGAEDNGVLRLEIIDPPATEPTVQDAVELGTPPSKEDIEEPALVVQSTVNNVAEPVSQPQEALDLVRDDPNSDEQSGEDEPTGDEPTADEPSSEDPSSDDPTADGPAQGEAPAGEDANQGEDAHQNAPTGDLDKSQAGQNQNAGDAAQTDSTNQVDAASAPEATARTNSAASPVSGADAERSSSMALSGATIGGVLPDAPMPKTGAATVGLLQTGLALIGLGGLLVAGTGRHRRVQENRREQGMALTI